MVHSLLLVYLEYQLLLFLYMVDLKLLYQISFILETSVSARKSIESGSAHLGRLFHLHSSDMSFTRHLAEISPMGSAFSVKSWP